MANYIDHLKGFYMEHNENLAGIDANNAQLLINNLEQIAGIISGNIINIDGDKSTSDRDALFMEIYGHLRAAIDDLCDILNRKI